MTERLQILIGDSRERLCEIADGSVSCCVTSPPYFGLRDYGNIAQIGLEATPDAYVTGLVRLFREVRRTLRDDGTLWLNLGDSYASQPSWGRGGGSTLEGRKQGNEGGASADRTKLPGLKPKDLIGVPWRVAFALQADGWYLRQDIIWHKPNPMPESARDRCTKAHEYLFLLSKEQRYYFDSEAMQEEATGARPGNTKPTKGGRRYVGGAKEHRTAANLHLVGARGTRNKRSVWSISPSSYKQAHFATFPPDLIEPCVLAGSPLGGVVLDPFGGSGTTAGVALKHGRRAILCELNPDYAALVPQRVASIAGEGWDLL